jgi:hypothetical protein
MDDGWIWRLILAVLNFEVLLPEGLKNVREVCYRGGELFPMAGFDISRVQLLGSAAIVID